MGRNITISGKMDVKMSGQNVTQERNITCLGWPDYKEIKCHTVTFFAPKKCSQKEIQSGHTTFHLDPKCQSGCSETLGVAVGGYVQWEVKMSLGRYVGSFFVKALVRMYVLWTYIKYTGSIQY